MRKLLLGTTAIAGAFGLAGSALAQGAPTVTVGGFVNFQVFQHDQDYTVGNGRGYQFSLDDAEVNVLVSGTAANGLRYGLKIELEAAGESNTNGTGGIGGLSTADEVVLQFSGDWGTLWLGDEDGVSDLMPYGAEILMAGPAGFDGDIDDVFNFIGLGAASSQGGADFIGPNLIGDTSDATKIQYYTPRIAGFQLGVSWTPDSGDNGGEGPGQTIGGAQIEPDNNTGNHNVYEIGLNFMQKFGEVDVGLSGVYLGGDSYVASAATGAYAGACPTSAQRCKLEDISSWALGGYVGFAGFRLGGTYGDSGDSSSPTGTAGGAALTNRFDSHIFWNVGADYTMGPWRFSAGYHQTTREYTGAGFTDDESAIFSAAIQYTVAPGLIAYVEYNNVSLDKSCDTAANAANKAANSCASSGTFTASNEGHVFILGTQLNF
jgi:outer membrane protein OmpU